MVLGQIIKANAVRGYVKVQYDLCVLLVMYIVFPFIGSLFSVMAHFLLLF
jgi:hypothetical protein